MSEDYKVAVAIAMSSNHAAVLGALAQRLLGVHTKVKDLEGGFGRLKTAIYGALAVAGGIALFDVMVKLVEKTKDYSEELVKIERLGGNMTTAVQSGAFSKKAFEVARATGMKVTDAMKIPGMTYSILGEQESMEHWESLAKLSTVLKSQRDYKGDPTKDIGDLIRAGELSGRLTDPATGKIDPAKFEKFLDTATRVIAATHNMVNANTLLGMSKQGGFMMRGLSEQGYFSMAVMAQAMGGNRAGTALLSQGQQMIGGTMFSRTAEGLEDLGLLKPGEWHKDHGRVILGDEASKRLSGLITKDPMALAAKYIEQFKKKGITDPEEQMRMILRSQGRQTTQRFTAEEVLNFQQMKTEIERMKGGYGKDDSFKAIMDRSVPANMMALSNAWDNLLFAVAGPNSPGVVAILKKLTAGLNWLQVKILAMKPETITAIAAGFGILAAAMIVLGGAAVVIAAGTFGWIVMGVMAVVGAMYALGKVDWKALGTAIVGWLGSIWTGTTSWIKAHPLGELISGWLQGMWDKIKSLMPSMGWGPARDKTGHMINPSWLDKKIWSDPDDGKMRAIPQSFHPGETKAKPLPISLSLNVDGRTLAQVISDKLDEVYRYDTSSPAFNGGGRFGA